VNSTTQEVVKTVSFQKQIIGHENEATLGGSKSRKILGLTGGVSAIEPIQAGVRALIELGVYQLADFVYTGENGSGCMSDTSRKYAALDTVRPVYNPPVYDEPRPMLRQAEPSYVRPTYNPPAYDNRNSAPTYAAPSPSPSTGTAIRRNPSISHSIRAGMKSPFRRSISAQSQYPGAYQGQVQPQYAPQQYAAPQPYAPQIRSSTRGNTTSSISSPIRVSPRTCPAICGTPGAVSQGRAEAGVGRFRLRRI